jgi:RNA polymerase sigma-70 factor (sigma-E family)
MRQDARTSFDDYVRARSAALSRVAYLLAGDAHLAEDLLQQTLINVASRWETIRPGEDPDPYVRRALYNLHISWWRQRRQEAIPMAQLPERAAPPHDDVATAVAVARALDRLAPRQRAVIVLRYFEDLTEAQAAQLLGIGVGTVKSTVREALAKLRRHAPELAELKEVDR